MLIQRLCLQCAVCKEDFLPLTYSGSSSITAPISQWSPGTSTLKRSRTSTITCTAPAALWTSLQVVSRPWSVSATTRPWTGLWRSPTTSTQVRPTSSSRPREGKLQQREGESSNKMKVTPTKSQRVGYWIYVTYNEVFLKYMGDIFLRCVTLTLKSQVMEPKMPERIIMLLLLLLLLIYIYNNLWLLC